MLQRLLDAFATRLGTALTVGAACALCIGAGLYFQFGANRLLASHEMFRTNHVRDGFVTMSDIARLTLILDKISVAGEMTPELSHRLTAALDILYVRADSMKTREGTLYRQPDTPRPSAAIFALVAHVDAAVAQAELDLIRLEKELLVQIDEIRARLVVFLDQVRRLEDRTLDRQASEVHNQARVMGITFVALGLFVATALILLRKEISARHAYTRAERRAEYLAFYDPLTGLPNRVQFTDRVQAILKKDQAVTVFLLDLDGFKQVNDTHGHAAGDAVLQAVGERIDMAIDAQNGIGARLSGDEFAVCLPTDNPETIRFYAESMLDAIRLPITYEGDTLSVRASVGAASSTVVNRFMDLTYSNLMRASDFALYAAKEKGKDTLTVYDDALETKFSERRGMLDDLRTAISSEALEVYLQPKVFLPGGLPYGFEALVRWTRNGELVPPELFITLAEESNLVTEIDLFVLDTASRLLADHIAAHGAHLSVSVNLSAMHFHTGTLTSEVRHVLETSGLAPELLTLEVTETVQIQDWDRVQFMLAQLSQLKCRISIDDFGSGYSSLAYLRHMTADEIKVDKSLIDDVATSTESQQVLKAIFELSSALGMDVVVEGIEDDAQSHVVQRIGCRRAQGYLYGRPEPVHAALERAMSVLPPPQEQAV